MSSPRMQSGLLSSVCPLKKAGGGVPTYLGLTLVKCLNIVKGTRVVGGGGTTAYVVAPLPQLLCSAKGKGGGGGIPPRLGFYPQLMFGYKCTTTRETMYVNLHNPKTFRPNSL